MVRSLYYCFLEHVLVLLEIWNTFSFYLVMCSTLIWSDFQNEQMSF